MSYVPNNLDTNPTAEYIYLLTFTWAGGSVVARYAASDKSITLSALVFSATPAISIDFGTQDGGVKDVPVKIIMPVLDPVATMLVGYPFSNCTVLIEEIDPSDTGTRRKLFYGVVKQAVGNKNGSANQCEVTVGGLKDALDNPLGIVALNTCVWQFNDGNCALFGTGLTDFNTAKVTRTLSGVSGNNLTVAAVGADNYQRGFVTYLGLSLLIRSQISTTELELFNAPPPSWLGQVVTITPGCRKTLADCSKWSNIKNFGGFGYGIPAYHPSVDTQ